MDVDVNLPDEFNKLNESEKQTLLNWCSSLEKIKTINHNRTSYSLKHIFERSRNGFYVTNGAFKGAMLECGFNYEVVNPTSPNWRFNVSERFVKTLV